MRTYRLLDARGNTVLLPPRAKVEVLTHLDDSKDILYRNQRYGMEACVVNKPEKPKPVSTERKRVGHKPSPDNPWLRSTLEKPKIDPVEAYFRKHEKRHLSTLSED